MGIISGWAIMVLGLVLLIATITDLAQHRVYNWLTFPALGLGLIFHGFSGGWPGLGTALLGLVIGGVIFFPVFFFGGMGAGDIKLMAVVGVWLGARFAVQTALYAAVAGGVVAVVILLWRGELWDSFKHIGRFLRSLVWPKLVVEPLSKKNPLPYAAMIAAGAVAAYFLPPIVAW